VLINALRGGRDKEFVAFRSRLITGKLRKFPCFAFQSLRIENEERGEYRKDKYGRKWA